MANNNEKAVKKITLEYEDGSVEELEKGLVWRFDPLDDGDTVKITAELLNMTGRDLYTVVGAAIEMGQKLGMFKGLEDAEYEES